MADSMGDSVNTKGGDPVLAGDEVEVAVALLRWRLALESAEFAGVRSMWVRASLDMVGYNLFESGR